ncbi:MAG: helix-turn-helix transcriptional regulator [Betaproteobacteria bacterium]|nr:helix-turn-helix transcriptional regulator [Betaproteobacteria bacterium]
METSGQSDALGAFVRAVRERLSPADFGLPQGRRRAKGLRREEVAARCGISPTWYTWIEQGRTTAISVSALARLAEGLNLSTAERAYLFRLAGRADPSAPDAAEIESAPLAALVEAIASPAYVLDRYWDALAWNAAAAQLFRVWLGGKRGAGQAPNLLRYVFLDPRAKSFILDWEERAQRLVAEYRADSAGSREDVRHVALVNELCTVSPVFDQAWRAQKVLAREGGSRGFKLGRADRQDYWQFTLRLAQQADTKLVVLHRR